MDEITTPLTDEGKIIETDQAPVTPEQLPTPGAEAACATPSPQDAKIIVIMQQIAPKFPNIDPNIIAAVLQEIESLSNKEAGPMAPGILAGRHSMQEIVEHLGFSYPEFKTDMKSLYSHYSNPADIAVSDIAVQNLFRSKYGLNISIAAMVATGDDESYWRTRLAYAVEKMERNYLEVGDEVIITADNHHFGKVGNILNLTDESADVLLDGIINHPITVSQPLMNLRLPTGKEKKAMLQIGPDTRKQFYSESYAKGLSNAAISKWYEIVGQTAYSKLAGLRPVTIHKVAGAYIPCEHNTYTGNCAAEVNQENLVSIYGRIEDVTNVAAMKVTPAANHNDYSTRLVVSDLLDEMVTMAGISDIQVRYAGDKSYFILVHFAKADKWLSQQQKLNRMVATYTQGTKLPVFAEGSGNGYGRADISTDVRIVPAAFSINPETGLVCVPLDPMKLSNFDVKQAALTYINEANGLNIPVEL